MTSFFDQEKFSMAPLLYVDVETFGGNQGFSLASALGHRPKNNPNVRDIDD